MKTTIPKATGAGESSSAKIMIIFEKLLILLSTGSCRPSDGLICTYDQHEDSVYASVWSTADTWTFASLSYAGRVVISQVPTGEKFKILGV